MIHIVPLEEKYFESWLGLIKEMAAFQKMPEKVTNSIPLMQLEKDYIHGFVAINANGDLIGYTTYFMAYFTWTGKSMYMDDLFVSQNFRGRGIGTQLTQAVIKKARSEQCKKVRWQVSHWNSKAIAFYRALGAEIDDIEKNCDLHL